tara:strand:+ start:1572 stop:1835 length:264 start_codon:yes stop_codon:yes gene_type:complete
MLKEIKYFIYLLVIFLFILLSVKFYISDDNIKKTFRSLNSVDINIDNFETKLPVISNDTDNIVKYLNNEDSTNKKKYLFWDLFKSED